MAFFREIRTSERITNRTNPQSFEYMKIKPETPMTENEAAEFWKGVFEKQT